MPWIKRSEDKILPYWITDNLQKDCPYCGSPILNYYNSKDECTNSQCSNQYCSGIVASKIADMCSVLDISGIKFKKALEMVRGTELIKSHFDAVPYLVKGEKMKITLATLFRISFIEGIDTKFEDICYRYSSVKEFFERYNGNYEQLLLHYKDILLEGEKKFDILPAQSEDWKIYEPVLTGSVVMTGTFPTLKKRESAITIINKRYQGLVNLRVSNTANLNILACIKEPVAPVRGKAKFCYDNNIPVLSLKEFIIFIDNKVKERRELNAVDHS